ncbi:hypothetical protein FKP32DRAFT_474675 [Trametes sanguinea]|nr:hypothetical protein FKP32DRAFT_474675 [Trametes sanguinea]
MSCVRVYVHMRARDASGRTLAARRNARTYAIGRRGLVGVSTVARRRASSEGREATTLRLAYGLYLPRTRGPGPCSRDVLQSSCQTTIGRRSLPATSSRPYCTLLLPNSYVVHQTPHQRRDVYEGVLTPSTCMDAGMRWSAVGTMPRTAERTARRRWPISRVESSGLSQRSAPPASNANETYRAGGGRCLKRRGSVLPSALDPERGALVDGGCRDLRLGRGRPCVQYRNRVSLCASVVRTAEAETSQESRAAQCPRGPKPRRHVVQAPGCDPRDLALSSSTMSAYNAVATGVWQGLRKRRRRLAVGWCTELPTEA